MIAADGAVSGHALTAAAASLLPAAAKLPAGSRIRLAQRQWRQTGRFANSGGLLLIPRRPTERIEVGFMLTRAGWRVTFLQEGT